MRPSRSVERSQCVGTPRGIPSPCKHVICTHCLTSANAWAVLFRTFFPRFSSKWLQIESCGIFPQFWPCPGQAELEPALNITPTTHHQRTSSRENSECVAILRRLRLTSCLWAHVSTQFDTPKTVRLVHQDRLNTDTHSLTEGEGGDFNYNRLSMQTVDDFSL